MRPAIKFYQGRYYEIRQLPGKPPPTDGTMQTGGLPIETGFDLNTLGELTFGLPTVPVQERRQQHDLDDLTVF